ncbi:MAG: hypothetical protein M3Z65_00690 [Chloroflexota bacterium]|nr:hypothetical protein [Chloroflexota bacterium]
MREPRIMRVEVGPLPRPKPAGFADPMPSIVVTFDDGQQKELMHSFYPDEWMVNEGDLLGMTEDEARAALRQKDIEYLRS